MKRLYFIFLFIILSLSCMSCMIEYNDYGFYGVVTNELIGETEQLYINIPNVGIVNIPKASHIQSYVGEVTVISELSEGQLVYIWFDGSKGEVSILESYPGQFNMDATSIDVIEENTSLSNRENDYYEFSFPLNHIVDDYSGLVIGAYVTFVNSLFETVDSSYTITALQNVYSAEVINLTDNSVTISVSYEYIENVLKNYHNGYQCYVNSPVGYFK